MRTDRALLTIADVAERLRISKKAAQDQRQRGVLPPAVTWGRTIRWREEDLEAWIEAHIEDVVNRGQ